MHQSPTPFLLFQDGRAEEAMRFYVETFGDARIVDLTLQPEDGPGGAEMAGKVFTGVVEIRGQRVMCTDSPPMHDFGFTPAVSFFLDCEAENDLDALYTTLSHNGKTFMPPDSYGFSKRFTWVEDRFGISWQLNLPSD